MNFPIPKQDRSAFVGELKQYVDQSRRDGSLLGVLLIHLHRLVELGCDCTQGFHMAKPMPATDLIRWLQESPWSLHAGSPGHGRLIRTEMVSPVISL